MVQRLRQLRQQVSVRQDATFESLVSAMLLRFRPLLDFSPPIMQLKHQADQCCIQCGGVGGEGHLFQTQKGSGTNVNVLLRRQQVLVANNRDAARALAAGDIWALVGW